MSTSRQTGKTVKILVADSIICPNCGVAECNDDPRSPTGKRFNINAYKIGDERGYWWSRCNVCKTWF